MTKDNLTNFNEQRKLYNKEASKEAHRERLKQFIKKKMTTIMVGAIDEFEKAFGEVWGQKYSSKEKTDEELDMTAIWNMCRDIIFDRGNAQIRGALNELNSYNIELIKHEYNFKKEGKE